MAAQAERGGVPEVIQVRAYTALDKSTLLGIVGAVFLLTTAIFIGGSPGSFVDLPSILIVILGTGFLTTACYSSADVRIARAIAREAFRRTRMRADQIAMQLVSLADESRKKGLLSLQHALGDLDRQPLLQQGLSMVVDGTTPDEVERIMAMEIKTASDRSTLASDVLKKAAELAPAMGLIGTLVGLVQMLANLDDPSTIGPSMSVALLTTFYGACLANMVLIPLATKMERNASLDSLINALYLGAVTSISRQENPRRLEMLLNTTLPQSQRISYFD